MRARIEITIPDAKPGKLAMIALAEIMTRLTAHVMRAGVVTPIKILSDDGATVAELTIENDTAAGKS